MSLVTPARSSIPNEDLDSPDAIDFLVRDFYRQVAQDDVIGPVFEGFGVDWSEHIPKLIDFWSWQLLGIKGYDGHPLRAHEPVNELFPFEPRHFERWVDMFVATIDDNFVGPHAEAAKSRARRMARALSRLLVGESGPGGETTEVYIVASAPGR